MQLWAQHFQELNFCLQDALTCFFEILLYLTLLLFIHNILYNIKVNNKSRKDKKFLISDQFLISINIIINRVDEMSFSVKKRKRAGKKSIE